MDCRSDGSVRVEGPDEFSCWGARFAPAHVHAAKGCLKYQLVSEDGEEHPSGSCYGICGSLGAFSSAEREGHRRLLLDNARNCHPLHQRSRSAMSKVVQTTVDILVAECLLGTDAHMRQTGGVLQRRRAEQEWKVGLMESTHCFRGVTGMPGGHRRRLCVGEEGCCSAAALGKGNTRRDKCAGQCHAEKLSVSRG